MVLLHSGGVADLPAARFLRAEVCLQIWAYHADIMDWGHVGAVGRSSEAVSAIAWAEPLGRPAELLAVASGSQVEILALKGPADSMQVCTHGRADLACWTVVRDCEPSCAQYGKPACVLRSRCMYIYASCTVDLVARIFPAPPGPLS